MTSFIRLYVTNKLTNGVEVELTEKQHHYLVHVMRREIGDEIALFNGRDGEWRAKLQILFKKTGKIIILDQLREQELEADLWLIFAMLKRGPIDVVTEKASELGVSKLFPVITGRTNSTKVNLDRLKSIAMEAAEQCGRLTVPRICEPQRLEEVLSNWPEGRGLVLLDESGTGKPIAEVMADRSYRNGDAICIGPEGGFESIELEYMKNLSFVTSASIGRRLVRAETAAIAALAVWQALAGDWIKEQIINN